jgi:hypothetical protein
MAVFEQELRARARRAYEWGRLGSKLPWALAAAPPAALALGSCEQTPLVLLQAALLAAALVLFLWRGQDYARGVWVGALVGAPAFALPFVFCASGLCFAGPSPALVALCFGGGLASGLVLTGFARWRHWSASTLVSSACVAALTAALGCSVAGLGGVLGAALGLVLAAGPGLVLARAQG